MTLNFQAHFHHMAFSHDISDQSTTNIALLEDFYKPEFEDVVRRPRVPGSPGRTFADAT
jgi:hypothetical protein